MTLGDVKVEALRLMGLDEPVNAENVSDYEEDENWAPLIRAVWGAVNRCFADLETKRVLPLRREDLKNPTGKGNWRRFRYDEIVGLFEPVRLVVESGDLIDDDHPFLLEDGGTLRVMDFDAGATYAVLYRPMPARLTSVSGDDTEIDLPAALCDALPWFVKSEVFRLDEPGEAAEARNFYENAVSQYAALAEVSRQGTVQSVYGVDLT